MELLIKILPYKLISHNYNLHQLLTEVYLNILLHFEQFLADEFSTINNDVVVTIILVYTVSDNYSKFRDPIIRVNL